MTFRCLRCKLDKDIANARRDCSYARGYRHLCHACDALLQRERRKHSHGIYNDGSVKKGGSKNLKSLNPSRYPILTEADAQYLAGLFDGEGHAGVHGRPRLMVKMGDRDPIDFFTLCLGGSRSISDDNRGTTQGRPRKRMYGVSINRLAELARAVPILHTYCKNESKINQLETCLRWLKSYKYCADIRA